MVHDERTELMKFRADRVLKKALQLRAVYEDKDMQDLIYEVLRDFLAADIEEVKKKGLVKGQPSADAQKQPKK